MIINLDVDSDFDEDDKKKQNDERIVIKRNDTKRKDKRKTWTNKNTEEFKSPESGNSNE